MTWHHSKYFFLICPIQLIILAETIGVKVDGVTQWKDVFTSFRKVHKIWCKTKEWIRFHKITSFRSSYKPFYSGTVYYRETGPFSIYFPLVGHLEAFLFCSAPNTEEPLSLVEDEAANRWPIKATCGSLKKIDDEKTWHKNEDEQQQKNEDVMVPSSDLLNGRQTSPF